MTIAATSQIQRWIIREGHAFGDDRQELQGKLSPRLRYVANVTTMSMTIMRVSLWASVVISWLEKDITGEMTKTTLMNRIPRWIILAPYGRNDHGLGLQQ